MLSAKPMEPVALAFPASLPPSPPMDSLPEAGSGQDRHSSASREPSRQADRLHILTATGRRLTTVSGQLPLDAASASQSPVRTPSEPDDTRSQLSLDDQQSRDSTPAQAPSIASNKQQVAFPRPDTRRRSSSKTDLLAVPEVDDTGKVAPEQVSIAKF